MAIYRNLFLQSGDYIKGILGPPICSCFVLSNSVFLQEAEQNGSIKGVKNCHRAPSVSYLLFVDDSLLLVKANRENAVQIQRILEMYE